MKIANKISMLLVIFSLILFSCRETKKEEPLVEIQTEKVAPETSEEDGEEENIESEKEYDSNEGESEIEESEEETDTLSIEE
ncbi:hypothetical protein [Aquimarina pacifica]|uniref:hypothetical protein n=1 Tax=Aquimarina pacifica TaxID=1296415 RepID=UPI0005540C51|nr:hypothetical protein [Aquimarina pacifica]